MTCVFKVSLLKFESKQQIEYISGLIFLHYFFLGLGPGPPAQGISPWPFGPCNRCVQGDPYSPWKIPIMQNLCREFRTFLHQSKLVLFNFPQIFFWKCFISVLFCYITFTSCVVYVGMHYAWLYSTHARLHFWSALVLVCFSVAILKYLRLCTL